MAQSQLSPTQLALLLDRPPLALEKVVNEQIEKYVAIAKECASSSKHLTNKLSFLPNPIPVTYDLRGRTAAYAYPPPNEHIQINLQLLLEHQNDIVNQAVPHEVAHVIQHCLWPKSSAHGREWQRIMISWFGLPADRTHSLPTKPVRVHPRKYGYKCSCRTHWLTSHLHTKIQRGQIRVCRNCHTNITLLDYVGEKNAEEV